MAHIVTMEEEEFAKHPLGKQVLDVLPAVKAALESVTDLNVRFNILTMALGEDIGKNAADPLAIEHITAMAAIGIGGNAARAFHKSHPECKPPSALDD